MFSKKVKIEGYPDKDKISVATSLVLLAIDELINEMGNSNVYGYQIMTHLRENFDWDVKSGTVYPILKKLKEDHYIRNEVTVKKGSGRHQIFYVLTRRGQKLVNEIKKLDSQKIDAALTPEKPQDKSLTNTNFSIENFAEKYVGPFLLDLDNKISKKISDSIREDPKTLDKIEEQINKTLEELNLCKSLLENEITKIKQIKKLKNHK